MDVYDITSVGPTLVLINCKWKKTCNPVNSKIQIVSFYSSEGGAPEEV